MTDSQEQEGLHQLFVTILPDGRMDTVNAALYLGLSRRTMSTWRYEKKGPRYIKRGRVFYFKSDLDCWLDGSEQIPEVQEA
jgi:hypothetical protein